MKKYLLTISPLLILLPSFAWAIEYIQSGPNGELTKITLEQFNTGCKTILYRTKAKNDLPLEHKKALLSALLHGETTNELSRAAEHLRLSPGFCTYISSEEAPQLKLK